MKGFCTMCERSFDDLEAHLSDKNLRGHKGRSPTSNEVESGTIWCKKCRNNIRKPRGYEWILPPKHDERCEPAVQLPDKSWVSPDGRDLGQFHLIFEPDADWEEEENLKGRIK